MRIFGYNLNNMKTQIEKIKNLGWFKFQVIIETVLFTVMTVCFLILCSSFVS